MYLGRFRLGEWVKVPLLGDDFTTASAVQFAPALSIYNAAGTKVYSGLMPPLDPYGAGRRLFSAPIRLSSAFAVGRYFVAMNYLVTSNRRYLKTANFDVVAGGNAAGNVIAMWYYPRPHATHLVLRTDADSRVLARNPFQ